MSFGELLGTRGSSGELGRWGNSGELAGDPETRGAPENLGSCRELGVLREARGFQVFSGPLQEFFRVPLGTHYSITRTGS